MQTPSITHIQSAYPMQTHASVNADRTLAFNGVTDSRYTLPVWSASSSRGVRVFFRDGDHQDILGGKFFGVMEALAAAENHRSALSAAGLA